MAPLNKIDKETYYKNQLLLFIVFIFAMQILGLGTLGLTSLELDPAIAVQKGTVLIFIALAMILSVISLGLYFKFKYKTSQLQFEMIDNNESGSKHMKLDKLDNDQYVRALVSEDIRRNH